MTGVPLKLRTVLKGLKKLLQNSMCLFGTLISLERSVFKNKVSYKFWAHPSLWFWEKCYWKWIRQANKAPEHSGDGDGGGEGGGELQEVGDERLHLSRCLGGQRWRWLGGSGRHQLLGFPRSCLLLSQSLLQANSSLLQYFPTSNLPDFL